MGFFSEFTSYKYADFAKKPQEIGLPRTASTTLADVSNLVKRVPRETLEYLYITDAQTNKTVNTYKQLLIQAGYRIVADNKTNQKQYDEFFNNIGRVGMHYKLEQLLERIIHDCALYGYAYVERIYDESDTYVLDLKPIDAKLMDYVRDTKSMIMTDLEQNPLGYVMNVGYYSDAVTDPMPKGAKVYPNSVFLLPKRIACFLVGPFGNGFESIGLIEPAATQALRKIKIEESESNAIWNSSDSLKYAIVGDAQRAASKPLMEGTLETLKNWTTNKRAVFPYPTVVGKLEADHSPQVQEHLKYLRSEQATSAGMSLGLAIGTGEENNKSTMNTERRDFNTKLNAFAKTISEQFTFKILDFIYKTNGYGSKAVLKWNNVSVDDKADMVALIKTLFDMGGVAPQEARLYAKNVLDLETNDEAYKEYILSTQYNPNMPNQSGPVKSDDVSYQVQKNGKVLANKNSSNPLQTEKNIEKSKDNYETKRQ